MRLFFACLGAALGLALPAVALAGSAETAHTHRSAHRLRADAPTASVCDYLDALLGPKHVPFSDWSGC